MQLGGLGGEEEKGRKGRAEQQSRTQMAPFQLNMAASAGQRKEQGDGTPSYHITGVPAALTSQGEKLPGPWTGKSKGTLQAESRHRAGGSEENWGFWPTSACE